MFENPNAPSRFGDPSAPDYAEDRDPRVYFKIDRADVALTCLPEGSGKSTPLLIFGAMAVSSGRLAISEDEVVKTISGVYLAVALVVRVPQMGEGVPGGSHAVVVRLGTAQEVINILTNNMTFEPEVQCQLWGQRVLAHMSTVVPAPPF